MLGQYYFCVWQGYVLDSLLVFLVSVYARSVLFFFFFMLCSVLFTIFLVECICYVSIIIL